GTWPRATTERTTVSWAAKAAAAAAAGCLPARRARGILRARDTATDPGPEREGVIEEDSSHEQPLRVRLLAAGGDQRGDLHRLRVRLLPAEDTHRLANAGDVLRLPGCAVHRDVRLSVDDLPALWVADQTLPGRRPL